MYFVPNYVQRNFGSPVLYTPESCILLACSCSNTQEAATNLGRCSPKGLFPQVEGSSRVCTKKRVATCVEPFKQGPPYITFTDCSPSDSETTNSIEQAACDPVSTIIIRINPIHSLHFPITRCKAPEVVRSLSPKPLNPKTHINLPLLRVPKFPWF